MYRTKLKVIEKINVFPLEIYTKNHHNLIVKKYMEYSTDLKD